ncbi:MAG: DUF3343 domain-containing protein [Bacillota bacterium]|nr:DUF3343 domain-containing protein [Bacillota bacterium]
MKKVVIAFATTSDAMAMEFFCKKNNVSGRLIAIPKELSAGCGLAWQFDWQSEEEALDFLATNGLAWEKMKLLDF